MSLRFGERHSRFVVCGHFHTTSLKQIGAPAPRVSAAIESNAAILASRIIGASIGALMPCQDPGSRCCVAVAIESSAAVHASHIVGSSIEAPVPCQDPRSRCPTISLRERSGLSSVARAPRLVGHSVWERPSPALEVRHTQQIAPLREEHLVSDPRRRSSHVEHDGFRFSHCHLAQSRAP